MGISARRATTADGVQSIASVQTAFIEAGVTPTWYVDEASLADYRALGLQAVVGGKLTPARNRALADARKKGKACVQCSDDLSHWEYRDGAMAKGNSFEEVNRAHAKATRFHISPVTAARFILAKMRGVDDGPQPQLGGGYILGDCSRTWAGEATSRHHFILGDFFVVDDSKVKFDEALTLKEDYDFCCQHIETHGSVMRLNRLTFSAKHYTNSGGAVDVRDTKGLAEQKNMAILFRKWPNAIFPHITRQNEVMLRWPSQEKIDQQRKQKSDVKRTIVKAKTKVIAKLPVDGVIMPTHKKAQTDYITKRVKRITGRTVADVVGGSLTVPNSQGTMVTYRESDFQYDLMRGFVRVQLIP